MQNGVFFQLHTILKKNIGFVEPHALDQNYKAFGLASYKYHLKVYREDVFQETPEKLNKFVWPTNW